MSGTRFKKVLVTGAAGGMGRACARLFGTSHELVLCDVAADPLDSFAEELENEGYHVAAKHAGDLCDPQLLDAVIDSVKGDAPFTVVHTAGLSPSMADARKIMEVNLVGTEKLLAALEPHLRPGSVAVLIASTAGHYIPVQREIEQQLAGALAPDFLDRMDRTIDAMIDDSRPAGAPGISYSLSKFGVLKLCERKAVDWGQRGCRIVTISPGMILTPMGRKELSETPGAAELNNAAPADRSGTPMDIAQAAQFLASDAASFITGSDLKVDGGSVAGQELGSDAASFITGSDLKVDGGSVAAMKLMTG